MAIVAYGYGLAGAVGVTNIFVDDIVIAVAAEPDITLDDEVTITLEPDSVDITLDADIDIEVE